MLAPKILIIGPAWIGDMVMAQTLFKLLQQQYPMAVIDVLAPAWGAALLARMPEVNQALALPFKHGEVNFRGRLQLGRQLRRAGYTQAIVLPNSWKSALVPFFAKIPRRTGWLRELRYGLLNDLRYLNKTKLPFMIQRFAALGLPKNSAVPFATLPKPALQVTSAGIAATLAQFNLMARVGQEPPAQEKPKKVLVLCPGAEFGPAKRWPAAHYASVAQTRLAAGWQVWLLGSVKDQLIAAEIQALTAHACIDLTGKTQLGAAIDLLACADLVISNDTGLMHVAAALARPLVVIYGSSSPQFTPPLHTQVKIVTLALPCSPCFKRVCPLGHLNCLTQLTPATVLQAATALVPL